MTQPISAIAHAGKPVKGSSPGLLGAADVWVTRTPFTCFANAC